MKNLHSLIIASITLLFCSQIDAQTSGSTGGNTIPTNTPTTHSSTNPIVNDSNLISSINDKISHDNTLAGTNITVSSQQGFVILDGAADSQAQIDTAIADAKTISGVKDVKSVIKIR